MLVKTWLNVEFDELFFYEYQKCQLRASYMANLNFTRRQYCDIRNKQISIRAARYVPYDDSLVYMINKKILFYTVNTMVENVQVDANWFKKSSAIILEKEIESNKKKSGRNAAYYNKIRNRVTRGLESLFNLIDTYDFDNAFKHCFTEKISLEKVITKIRNGARPGVRKSIPEYDYRNNFPFLKIDLLALTYDSDNNSIDITMSHIFDVSEDMMHRNFFVKILFRYFYEKFDELNFEYGLEISSIRKVILYNPLTMKKIEVMFADLRSTLSEMDLFRIMNAYIDNNLARSLDNTNCKYCENNKLCYSKTSSKNKQALHSTFENKRSKQTQELI